MQKLHNDLSDKMGHDVGSKFTNLLDTSVKWAEYVLRNNQGKALEHGLNIAKELANYYEEISS